jgi:surface polysaccharide O-acyltransferase-like enzyme
MNNRLFYMDHLRTFLTILVVFHHAATTYAVPGSWYFFDTLQKPDASFVLMLLFVFINQAFFMGLFFFIAGYFVPSSFDRKGPKPFLKDRLIRLGIPLIVYIFLISPVILYTTTLHYSADASKVVSFWEFYRTEILSFAITEPGPLWFLLALLVFSAVYTLVRMVRKDIAPNIPFPSVKVLLLTAALIGLVTFGIRQIFPIGTLLFGLNFGYFPAYIVLFIAGIIAYRNQWLMSIPRRTVKIMGIIALVVLPILPIAALILNPTLSTSGGLNINAFIYAMWEPFVGFGISLLLLAVYRKYRNQTNQFQRSVDASSYTVYIIHSLVLVAYSIWLHSAQMPSFIEFLILGGLGTITSYLIAMLIRKIPYAKKIL